MDLLTDDEDVSETDEGGEADEIEAGAGLREALPPRANPLCAGHAAVETHLLDMIAAGRLPHGLIFSGPPGIGKATMAFRLARFLLRPKSESETGGLFGIGEPAPSPPAGFDMPETDPVFLKIASAGHPDLLVIERPYDEAKGRQKAELGIDQVRKAAPFLRLTASGGGWRIVIVDDADTMTRPAQNAILKILEEPPPAALVILVAHRLGALLPTIRSRARILPFAPLDPAVMSGILDRLGVPRSDAALATALSEGSIGAVLSMTDAETAATLRQTASCLTSCTQTPWEKIHALATQLDGSDREPQWVAFRVFLESVLTHLVRLRASGRTELPAALASTGFSEWLTTYPLRRLMDIREAVVETLDRAHFAALDRKTAVLSVFSTIHGGRPVA